MKTEPKRTEIRIALGSAVDINYIVALTGAPKSYDGFGTIEILSETYLEDRPARMVLIQERHFDWQMGRYSSGMFACSTDNVWATERDIVETLYARLIGGAQ